MFLVHRLSPGLLLLALVIIASACSAQQPAQTTTDTPASPANTQEPEIIDIPEPGDATGVVHGMLLNAQDQQPITRDNAAADIFLAKIVYTTEQQRPFSLLDQENSPRTIPDTQGGFVFDQVEPGEYAISVVTPLGQVVARSAENIEEDLVFTVEAGQTIDVGEIYARYP
ncbi:MAG: hypothetical protein HC828_20175 [Blastochloris sp.]|nr:hypothetical protein [Blastochloris sp.]